MTKDTDPQSGRSGMEAHRPAETRQLLQESIEERNRELAALLEISARLSSTLDLERVLLALFEQFKRVVDFDSVAISFLKEDGYFMLLEYSGPAPLPKTRLQWRPQENDPEEMRDLLHRRTPLIISDVRAETEQARTWRANARRNRGGLPEFVRCWMAVPLVANDRNIGLLSFEHHEPGYYTERHGRLALALANQAAVSLENARLFRLEQRRAEQFRLIGEVSRQITRILALDEVANQAAYHIQQVFGYSHVHVGLVEGDAVVFRPQAGVWRDRRQCHYCGRRQFTVGKVGAAGQVAGSGKALIVRDVRRDPLYVVMNEDQEGSAVILPLKTGDEVVGVLNIESDEVAGFDQMDLEALQPLANQLAIALENARLYEQSQKLAALQERQKLARELHDSVSQAIYGIGLGARTAIKLLEEEAPDRQSLSEALDYVLSLATGGLAEMRALIFELRPEFLEAEGLCAALNRHAEALRARHNLALTLHMETEPQLPTNVKEVLYRVAQEALQNVVKHAGATQAHLTLRTTEGSVTLQVQDNGRGFDVHTHFPGHLGLQSMRERLESINGAFTLESAPEGGTRVTAMVPVQAAHATASQDNAEPSE